MGLDLLHHPPPHAPPRLPHLRMLRVVTALPRQLMRVMHVMSRDARLFGAEGYKICDDVDDMYLHEDALDVDTVVGSEEQAAALLGDMALLAQHILATRHLTEVSVGFHFQHYSARDVAATLGPLAPRIASPIFDAFLFAPSGWREIEALLSSVRPLGLWECTLKAEMLARSGQLLELHFFDCDFMEEWVVDMADVHTAPLLLSACPRISPHIIAQCIAAAERVHGARHITFK